MSASKNQLLQDNLRLRQELAEIITFATTRKQDGIEMGAVVWKIALEDIIKDARNALRILP